MGLKVGFSGFFRPVSGGSRPRAFPLFDGIGDGEEGGHWWWWWWWAEGEWESGTAAKQIFFFFLNRELLALVWPGKWDGGGGGRVTVRDVTRLIQSVAEVSKGFSPQPAVTHTPHNSTHNCRFSE